jgi:hypothetical protein
VAIGGSIGHMAASLRWWQWMLGAGAMVFGIGIMAAVVGPPRQQPGTAEQRIDEWRRQQAAAPPPQQHHSTARIPAFHVDKIDDLRPLNDGNRVELIVDEKDVTDEECAALVERYLPIAGKSGVVLVLEWAHPRGEAAFLDTICYQNTRDNERVQIGVGRLAARQRYAAPPTKPTLVRTKTRAAPVPATPTSAAPAPSF